MNPRHLLNSNIQYQFLKFNSFTPMSIEQHCSEDKVECGVLQRLTGLANYMPADKFAPSSIYCNLPANNWQPGLQRYDPLWANYQQ